MTICLRHKICTRETVVFGVLNGQSRDRTFENTHIHRIPLSYHKNQIFFGAHSCVWQFTFDELYPALADCNAFGSCSMIGAVGKCRWRAGAAGTEPCPGRPATRRWQRRRRSASASSAVNYG